MQEYEAFVEKFKPKLTTDDCYTPPEVYEAVKNWAVREYGLQDRTVVRPFVPRGDYKRFDYPANAVVIDNPPFSILAEIKSFYLEHGIAFFLFAPHLTLFSSGSAGVCYVVTDCKITYENGAVVNTDFVTSLDRWMIRTAPELRAAVKEADKYSRTTKKQPRYEYPKEVISSARLGRIAGLDFRLKAGECRFTRAMDAQRACGKSIFGGGYYIAELKAAELKAAELKAAEPVTEWEMTEREREIIRELGND